MNDSIIRTTGTILQFLSIEYTDILVKNDGDVIRVDVVATEPSRLIGFHGETLNALQHLTKSILRTELKTEKAPFIVMDVDGYRTMQEAKVRSIAEAKAEFVRRTGARVTLPPMSPYFRRIVHTHVSATPSLSDITTESVGEGDYRQVVIRLKNPKAPQEIISEELSPVITSDDGLENLDI
jgi:spoIIIJ-associated protein